MRNIFYSFICSIPLLTTSVASSMADGNKSGLGLGFSVIQSIWQGKRDNPKMTTCRLIKRKVNGGDQMCLYKGAQSTFEAIYNDKGGFCPRSISCRLYPDDSKNVSVFVKAFMNK